MELIGIDPAGLLGAAGGSPKLNVAEFGDAISKRVQADVATLFTKVERDHFLNWLANDHGVTPESSELTVPMLQELYGAAFAAHKGDCWLCTRQAGSDSVLLETGA